MLNKLYDKALYAYLYAWIWIDHQVDRFVDHRANVKWARENPDRLH